MSQKVVLIQFNGISAADANQMAPDLVNQLGREFPEGEFYLRKASDSSQDFGSIVAIVLGASSTIAIAKGISTFLRRNSGARISIVTENGVAVATGLDSKDAVKIAEALAKANPE
jgi:hypothetical protein